MKEIWITIILFSMTVEAQNKTQNEEVLKRIELEQFNNKIALVLAQGSLNWQKAVINILLK